MGRGQDVSGSSQTYTALEPFDPTSIGPFPLIGRIGVGGMGVVYLGGTTSGERAAVKVVRPEVPRFASGSPARSRPRDGWPVR
jgi:hypothetical protein